MTTEILNDNTDVDAVHGPDAHGQAAMLLVESLIHGLVDREVISVGDAIEIVDIAADVKAEVAEELGDSPANLRKSLGLLASVSSSLRHDAQCS
ncbi:MAG TPA: hypothetical protein VFF48_11050 [Brevundimonas sp.]|nr:hypothetical protein [Brevundimonas sp.]